MSKRSLLLRRWLRMSIVSIVYYSGFSFLINLFNLETKLRILMYHGVEENPVDSYAVSPAEFDEQMAFLAQHYHVISLKQWIGYLRGENASPQKPVVITFDDGFLNNYTEAYSILKKYHLPATVFVLPDRLDKAEEGPSKSRFMNWQQLKEMQENGIEVGSHTVSHRSLPTLTLAQVRDELLQSKAHLAQSLGQPIMFLAYPYGARRDFNREIVKLVAECGYDGAVTSLSGVNGRQTNPYLLRRTEIEAGDSIAVFRKTMTGALDLWGVFEWLRWVSQVLCRQTQNK